MAMPGAAPDRGAETAEGTAVASARPQGTALVTENLNGEAVTAAGTDRGARPVAASAGIAMTGAAAACIARTRADATGGAAAGPAANGMPCAAAAADGIADARTGANDVADAAAVADGMSVARTGDEQVAGLRAGAEGEHAPRRRPGDAGGQRRPRTVEGHMDTVGETFTGHRRRSAVHVPCPVHGDNGRMQYPRTRGDIPDAILRCTVRGQLPRGSGDKRHRSGNPHPGENNRLSLEGGTHTDREPRTEPRGAPGGPVQRGSQRVAVENLARR